tara:strand:+ start:1528 stop:1917 length:390 start_codon:yes stop_codon:yes gene_type:complete
MNNKKDFDAYKSISEVAELLNLRNPKNGNLSTHTLRYWEKEFKQIKPKIFAGQRRYYDEKSVDTLKKIKILLKDRGMTIKGVKKYLNEDKSDLDVLNYQSIKTRDKIKNKLKKISKIIKKINYGKKNSH